MCFIIVIINFYFNLLIDSKLNQRSTESISFIRLNG